MATETVNITTTLADDSVTNAKLANMTEATFKGRKAGVGTGDPQDMDTDSASFILDTATDPFVRTSVLPTIVEEDPGPGVGLIESGAGVSPIVLKNLKNGLGTSVGNNTGSVQVDIDFTAADRYYYSDGSALPVEGTITSAGRDLLDDANAAAQRTTLGATTVGGNYFTLANPGAVTFPRQNADNTVTSRTAAELLADLGLGPTLLSVAGPLSTTSASLANVTGAVFSSVPVGMLEVQFMIDYDSAATTVGAYFSIDGTATQNYLGVNVLYNTTQGDNPSRSSVAFNSGGTATSSRATTGNVATVNVRINVTVTGTIQLRFATEAAGNAITIQSVTGFLTKVG